MSAQASADPPDPSAKPPVTGQPVTHEAAPQPAPAAPPPPTPPAPAQPPAAATVLAGARSEHEIELEAELKTERDAHATTAAEKKAREQRINELEDELRKLKELPKMPAPKPKTRSRVRLTFFDPAD